MKIALFDAKDYDIPFFQKMGEKYKIEYKFFETKLNADTADLARGFDGVCVFVNDDVGAEVIDRLYEKGLAAGALGGKLLGAGGGGFLLFYVRPERQEAVRQALNGLLEIPFRFENGGSRVIHYSPERYEQRTSS